MTLPTVPPQTSIRMVFLHKHTDHLSIFPEALSILGQSMFGQCIYTDRSYQRRCRTCTPASGIRTISPGKHHPAILD